MNKLNRRRFCTTLLATAAAGMPLAAQSRPNIVFVLADDLGWGDFGCYNPRSGIPTPNADRLARDGVRFTDMHSPSAVCTPTRYGILTGRYCWRTHLKNGVLWGYSPNLIEPGRMTVGSLLQSRGYRTGVVGKWHLGLGDQEKTDYTQRLRPGPLDHGFDYFFGIPASLDMEPYVYVENDHVVEQPTSHTEGQSHPRGVFWRPGPIAPGFEMEEVLPTLTEKAMAFIRKQAQGDGPPFFLYFPLTAPHTPWVPTSKFRGKSKAGDYGDFVVQVDAALGEIMRTLDETGLAGDTLLIFTSDNGAHWNPEDKARFAHRANADWRGMKADIWEGGHRVPFLARWPGKIPAGSTASQLGCLTDLVATAAEIVGAPLPDNAAEDSYSLLPAMRGHEGGPTREAIVHHSMHGMFSIRQAEWKLILGRGSGGFSEPKLIEVRPGEAAGQLYNVSRDPHEENDLYKQQPDVVARLTALLEKYQKQGHSRPL